VGVNHHEPFWHFENSIDLHEFVSRIARPNQLPPQAAALGDPAALRAMLLTATPSLVSLLHDHHVTALIALSDRMAREYHYWLTSVGITIPDDLSIVSFDNSRSSVIFPISTVDFGFPRLGYLAAHILINDVAVKADATGSIAGICQLRERGSLGPPRTKRLSLR